jgi:hypothetical protein
MARRKYRLAVAVLAGVHGLAWGGCSEDTSPDSDAGAPMCDVSERPSRAPGPALEMSSAAGEQGCAGTSLAQVVDAIHAAHPELADIRDLYPSTPDAAAGDQSLIYAHETPDGGFALAFRRGGGDCPSGCAGDEYWYFRTDALCQPEQIGHLADASDADAGAACRRFTGFPLWDRPSPPDPVEVCGYRPSSELSGTYTLPACGQALGCTVPGQRAEPRALDLDLQFEIAQDDAEPGTGTLTLSNTGDPAIDGRPLPATFTRGVARVDDVPADLPSNCQASQRFQVLIDFDGYAESYVRVDEAGAKACSHDPEGAESCNASIQLDLGWLGERGCREASELQTTIATAAQLNNECEQDSDCALVEVDTSCLGACGVSVRADRANAMRALITAAADAHCHWATCAVLASCAQIEAGCNEGACTTRLK